MFLFKNISLRAKLYINFAIILILTIIVGWQGIVGMSDINKELNSIYTEQFVPARIIANTNISLFAWNRAMLYHVLSESKSEMEEYEQIILAEKIAITERLEELSNMKNLSEKGMEMVSKLQDDFLKTDLVQNRVVSLSREGKQEEARLLIKAELRPIVDAKDKNMTEILLLQEKQLDEIKISTDTRYEQGKRRIFLIIGSALVFIFLITFLLSNMIIKNINKLVRGMKFVEEGKFKSAKVNVSSKDEFGYLGAGFNQMADKIEQSIIEIKQVQEELLRQEKLAVLGKLSGSIAHEIKNPLGVIDSSVYYLKMKLKDVDEKTQLHLDRIKSQVKISTNIIQSLQNLTKIREPINVRMDLADAVEAGIALSKPPSSVKLVKEVPVNHLFVDADREQLAMLFKNIISNAVQAMDYMGNLWVTAEKTTDGWCKVSFRDSGPGITPENRKRIFEPLFSTKAKGIGFGLTIAQMVSEKHGGTIEFQTEAGGGSTFIVRLPLIKT